ncbi:lysostaphin resistance A-like protein [Asticcacaulis solisilvae]|uniref:lysostaphin resistance A-like protein n=1 Tax=Asticcacaulis solisilvae TaxID=1217274 RepID=UPI003FD7E717
MAGDGIYPSNAYRRTWPPLTIPLVWLFVYAGVWLSGQIAQPLGFMVTMGNGRWTDNIAALFASLPVAGVLWLWLRYYERGSVAGIGLYGRSRGPFLRGAGIGALLVFAVAAAGVLAGAYQIDGPGAWTGHFTSTWVIATVLSFVGTAIQATATEALYRGWMLDTVAARWGRGIAVIFNVAAALVIQAGLNALSSPESLIAAINLALMSAALSLIAIRTGSLWTAAGLHAGWNLAMGWALGLNIDGGHLSVTPGLLALSTNGDAPSWLSGGGIGPDGSLLFTLAAAGLLLSQMRFPKGGERLKAVRPSRDDDEIVDH